MTGDTAIWFGYVRITPFVHFEGLLGAECNTIAAPFAPRGIKTYVGTRFLCFDRLIFSCGHVSFFSQYHNGHGPTNSQTLTVFPFGLALVIPAKAAIQKTDRQGRLFEPNAVEMGLLAHPPGPRI